MRLVDFSDYALDLLMYAGAQGDRLVTFEETANLYGISRAHRMKVANQLTRAGFLKGVRERHWLPERRPYEGRVRHTSKGGPLFQPAVTAEGVSWSVREKTIPATEEETMRMMLKVTLDTAMGNEAIKTGSLSKTIGAFAERAKPGVSYFTVPGQRCGLFFLI